MTNDDRLLKAMRKFVDKRRTEIIKRYSNNLTDVEYRRNLGRDEENKEMATFLQEQVRRMNDPDAEDEKDE